jgi:OFA family oxalate/formate antiporter-like MFS transporter
LIDSKGVLATFEIFGILFGVLIVAAAFFLKNPPIGYQPEGWTPPAPAPGAAVSRDYTSGEILRIPHFYYLAIMMLLGCLSGLMIVPFAKIMAADAGLSETMATSAIMLIAVANASGRLFWGASGDKIGRVKTISLMLLVGGTASLVLTQLDGIMTLVGIGFITFCYGGFLGAMPATVGEFFGMKNVGVNYGMVLLFFGFGAFVAPQISGMIKDTTGTLTMALIIGGVAQLCGLFLAYLASKPMKA